VRAAASLNCSSARWSAANYKQCKNLKMDFDKMLAELRSERQAIEEAILVIERLAAGRGKRRAVVHQRGCQRSKDAAGRRVVKTNPKRKPKLEAALPSRLRKTRDIRIAGRGRPIGNHLNESARRAEGRFPQGQEPSA
jgi:hypothetical protein